jgi:hypothetical protein
VLGSVLEPLEQWRRVAQRATATGSAWIHALPLMKVVEIVGSGTSSSSLSPCAGGDLQQQQKTQQPVDFSFSLLCFQICVSFSFSPFRICSSLQISSFPFCFPFSILGGRLYDQEGRRLLGFCRVWPAEMEKRSVVAHGRWSCCGDGRGG